MDFWDDIYKYANSQKSIRSRLFKVYVVFITRETDFAKAKNHIFPYKHARILRKMKSQHHPSFVMLSMRRCLIIMGRRRPLLY